MNKRNEQIINTLEDLVISNLHGYFSPNMKMAFVVLPDNSSGLFYIGSTDKRLRLSSPMMFYVTETMYTLDAINDARKWLDDNYPDDKEAYDDLDDLEQKFNKAFGQEIAENIKENDASED